jgi:hypothetical protein
MKGMTAMSETNMTLSAEERAAEQKRQRMRSLAIALGLGFLVIMFYAATIVHLGANVMNRPI